MKKATKAVKKNPAQSKKGPASTESGPPIGSESSSEHTVSLREIDPKLADKVKDTRESSASQTDPPQDKPGPAPEFNALKTVEELVEAYNDMVPTAIDLKIPRVGTVKSFVDAKTGQLACERLHDQITKARFPEYAKEKQKVATKSKKSKTSNRTAVRGKTTAAKGGAKGGTKTRVTFDESAKISVKVKENPCREGTAKFKRYETLLSHNGKTVATYLSHKGNPDTLRNAIRNKIVSVA